ncbi:MAG: hypothetical protein U0521_03810 [Anaerolineae bacterium]
MTTEDFIISLFCLVDDRMGKLPKRSDASLYPSEVVTIGLLYALKGGFFRAFYRWLKRDFERLFVELPDRTRIQRALCAHRDWGDRDGLSTWKCIWPSFQHFSICCST